MESGAGRGAGQRAGWGEAVVWSGVGRGGVGRGGARRGEAGGSFVARLPRHDLRLKKGLGFLWLKNRARMLR